MTEGGARAHVNFVNARWHCVFDKKGLYDPDRTASIKGAIVPTITAINYTLPDVELQLKDCHPRK